MVQKTNVQTPQTEEPSVKADPQRKHERQLYLKFIFYIVIGCVGFAAAKYAGFLDISPWNIFIVLLFIAWLIFLVRYSTHLRYRGQAMCPCKKCQKERLEKHKKFKEEHPNSL